MPGSGIWQDSETYLQQAGQIWAQQQQTIQSGHDWASQQIADTLSKLQAMVPQVGAASAPAPAPAPTPTPAPSAPPPAPIPTPAPPPPLPIGGTPVATPAPSDVSAGIAPPAASPTAIAPVPTPPAAATPSLADAGQNWAQQQIQNLLNPSQPTPPTSPTSPDLSPPTSAATALPEQAQAPGGIPPVAPATPPGAPAGPQSNTPGDLIDQTRQAATAAGIDPDLFSRQIKQESGFDPNAGSPAGARGIAQFMPQTAQGLGINPDDPNQALPAAANLMRSYLDKYGGDWSKALQAYNAGPGNVDKYGGNVPFEETQTYVKNILGGAGNVVQQGLSAVNTGVQAAQSAIATRASQFGLGLSSGDAMAFCGPTAAIAFAQTYGRNPTVDEAKQLAQQVGWNPDQGMAGVGSEVQLLKTMGVDAHATSGVDWSQVGRDASGGNPVIIDTPGHYYYVDGYNQQTGQLHVGTSGTDLKGGSEWMTPDQINAMPQSHGGARAAIFADHPLAQQDGLAQSAAATGNQAQPANPLAPYSTSDPYGYGAAGVPYTPPDLGAGASQLLQQGRNLVGSLLQPDQNAPASLRSKANGILQAVQDVGSQATQAGQGLLQQGQQALQQAPQTVSDILNQNALTSQGVPNIGGNLLEGIHGSQFYRNLTGTNPDQAAVEQRFQEAQQQAGGLTGGTSQIPSNPLELLGSAGLGAPTSGEYETEKRNAVIAAVNPLRDMPFVGGASTAAAQMGLDPTNLFLLPELAPGKALASLANEPGQLGEFLRGESGQLNLGALRQGVHNLAQPQQPTLPGMEQAAGPQGMQRVLQAVRDYHVGNVISSPATLAHVALTSAISPLWSLGARGIEDLATLQPSRAAGSVLGAQTAIQGAVGDLLEGLQRVYSRPTALPGAMGRVWQTPAALHSMFQTAAGNAIQDMELGRLAGQQASREGLTGGQWITRTRDLITNPVPGWLDSAKGVADRATLRGELGTMGQFFANLAGQGEIGGTGGTARQALGNVLAPVFRIGMNSLTQLTERSPLGLAGTAFDVARSVAGVGPYAGGQFARPVSGAVTPLGERLTNNLIGTALSVWLAGKAVDGTVTGEGPDDPGQAATLRAQGWQPHSMLLGGNYVDYSHLPPAMQGPLRAAGAYADAVEAARQANRPLSTQSPLGAAAASLFHTVGTTFADDTPLRTLSDIYQMIKDPSQAPSIASSTLANVVGSYVPMSAAVRGGTIAADPYARRPNALFPGSFGQALEQDLPVLRGNVPIAQDVLGRQQQNPQMGLGALLPNIGRGTPSPVAGAFATSGMGMAQPPPTVAWNGREIRLTPDEKQTYQQIAGERLQLVAGRMLDSPGWQALQTRVDAGDERARAIMQTRLAPLEEQARQYAETQVVRGIPLEGPEGKKARAQFTRGPLATVIGYQPEALSQANFAQHRALINALLTGG